MSPTVYTGGTFDLFHAGHVDLLKQCRVLAGDGRVVVALNTDQFIYDYKGFWPTIDYKDRRTTLLACRYVDEVVENFGGADSRPTIEAVRPSIIAIGSDWAPPRDYLGQMGFTDGWLSERDITLVYVHRPQLGTSSSKIRSRIDGERRADNAGVSAASLLA